MGFSPPEYCRLFAQKKAYQGGSRAPKDPPSYAPVLRTGVSLKLKIKPNKLKSNYPVNKA